MPMPVITLIGISFALLVSAVLVMVYISVPAGVAVLVASVGVDLVLARALMRRQRDADRA